MRGAIALAAGLALAAAPAAAADELDAAFRILRAGHPIGHHIVDVTQRDGALYVETRIDMRVKFGPLPVFRYRHRSTEIWRDGALASIEGRTDDNGVVTAMRATREGGVLIVDSDAYKGPAPAAAAPSTYWNRDVVAATMLLSTQNGDLIEIESAALGWSLAPSGAAGEHFRLQGTVALDLWYDGEQWSGAQFTIDGEELTYVPLAAADRERLVASLE